MALDIFKGLEKLNEHASVLSEGGLSSVSEWIDTGSYALNVICSGRARRGVPKGRIIGFSGPSGCGKTLFINKIFGRFQALDKDNICIYFDTEAAADEGGARNVGADPSRIRVFPVETVEECRNQLTKLLDAIGSNPKAYGKVMVAIDSLGNLAGTKELEDAAKDKTAADMGLRAKALKSMMRTITYKAAKTGTTILFSNHTYDDPAALYESIVKNQSGGKGPVYLASLLIQLAHQQEQAKKAEDIVNPIARKIMGINMRALTVKNRFAPPFLETNLTLNFTTGLDKYSGLLDIMVGYNVIEQTGSTYVFNGKKLGYYKNWKSNVDLWENELIPALDVVLEEKLNYANESDPHTSYVAGSNLDSEDEDEDEDEVE